MEKNTDEIHYQSMNFFEKDVIPMIPNKSNMDFLSSIDNGNVEKLRKDEQFNKLVTSLIKLYEKEKKNITREEAELLAIDILGGSKKVAKSEKEKEKEKDTIGKFMELSNSLINNYIQKHKPRK